MPSPWRLLENLIRSGGWSRLSGSAQRLLPAIVAHMNGESRCWPSQSRLAEMTGCSRSTVKRAMCDLVESGVIHIDSRGHGRTNDYTAYGSLADQGSSLANQGSSSMTQEDCPNMTQGGSSTTQDLGSLADQGSSLANQGGVADDPQNSKSLTLQQQHDAGDAGTDLENNNDSDSRARVLAELESFDLRGAKAEEAADALLSAIRPSDPMRIAEIAIRRLVMDPGYRTASNPPGFLFFLIGDRGKAEIEKIRNESDGDRREETRRRAERQQKIRAAREALSSLSEDDRSALWAACCDSYWISESREPIGAQVAQGDPFEHETALLIMAKHFDAYGIPC